MKKFDILTLVAAIAVVCAFVGGMKLSSGQKEANRIRIADLESEVGRCETKKKIGK